MKTKITLVLLVLFSICSFGQVGTVFTTGGLNYKITTATTVEVTQNTNITGSVTIPSTVIYNSVNYQVNRIGFNAFIFNLNLTSVTIPNSVTIIGTGAFYNCTGLASVAISNSVLSIGTDSFAECYSLTSVNIPNSVTTIGETAFFNCQSLISVTIPNSVTSIGRSAFQACAALSSVIIPNSVTSIENYAFLGCSALTSVTIPNSITSISLATFQECTNLTSIIIPSSVTSIGQSAFADCTRLATVNIPNTVTSIGENAFYYCRGLISVTVNSTTPLTINANVFQGLTLSNVTLNVPAGTQTAYDAAPVWTDFNTPAVVPVLGQTFAVNGINYIVTKSTLPYEVAVGTNRTFAGVATIPATVSNTGNSFTVTSIRNSAFESCTSLTSITIANSVTSIGNSAFLDCTGLTSFVIPNSVTSIDDFAFARSSGLTSISIPNSVTSIGNSIFEDCTGLTSVSIPNSLTTISTQAFNGCTGLTSISIPSSITRIGILAFRRCTSLTTVSIPNSVTTIANGAFQACTGLTSVTIPNSVNNIENGAFFNCTSLTSVTIPNSVSFIGIGAFQGCTGLTSVKVYWTNPITLDMNGLNAFSGLTLSNITLNVPVGRVAAYDDTPVWTDFGSIVEPVVAPVVGQTFAENGINYIVTKATLPYEVAVGNNSSFVGVANIPASVTNAGNSFAVTSISDYAFTDCTGLTSVTIGNSVTSIGYNAFFNCSGLTSVTIPNSVTSISGNVFTNCTGLTSVNIGNSVTSIGGYAFGNCTGLTSVNIPNSVSSIGERAFEACSNLTSVTIGNSVTSIGDFAFQNCFGLISVTIPNSVTSIGRFAFYQCQGLISVSIPNSVTNIGSYTFGFCTGLTSVTVNWTTPVVIDNTVFYGSTPSNIILIVPTGTASAYEEATNWTDFRIETAVNNVLNYCKGAIAQPLVAPFLAGSTVKWYTVATGGRVLAAAPTPTTSIVGTKLYYVSEVVGGVESARETITVNTFALPATPGAIIGTAAQGALVGTTNTATYSIADVVGAVSYVWTAPPGVNIISGQGTNTVTVNFANVPEGAGAIGNLSVVAVNSNDCNSLVRNLSLTKALPIAPSSIRMTDATLPIPSSGIPTAVTTFAPYMGTTTELTLTARPVATATSYVWELPTGVNVTNGSATTVGGVTESTLNVITVNFSGVTNANTFNYLTTAAVPVATNNLRIGVYSKNGTGLSTTNNAALANSSLLFTPNNTSTARLLTLTAVRPVAPTSLKMYNPLVSTTVAVTDISKFIGTNTELTLTAAVSKLASSYTWEIPSTVTVVAGSDLTSNSITINFLNVPAGTASLYLGVKAVNGIGSSVTVNPTTLVPATTSEARLLKVTAIAPSIVSTVTGSLKICPTRSSDVVYSIATAATRANTYNITVPMGCTINGGTTNTATIVATAGATFTVNYPASFIANTTTSIKKIFIQSENGFGVSTTNKILSLTNVGAVCAPRFANTTIADEFEVIAYPNPSSSEFTIETFAKGAISVKIYDMQGRLVENTNSTQVGSRLAAGTYNVIVNQGANTKAVRVIKQ